MGAVKGDGFCKFYDNATRFFTLTMPSEQTYNFREVHTSCSTLSHVVFRGSINGSVL